jgi:hypothetical protein
MNYFDKVLPELEPQHILAYPQLPAQIRFVATLKESLMSDNIQDNYSRNL